MRFTLKVSLLAIVMTAIGATQSQAAYILFTNRAAFQAATGTLTTETFNSIATDTSFLNSSLAFAGTGVTLQSTGGAQADVLVDVPTYQFNPGAATIDGTARVNMGGLLGTSVVSIQFGAPVSAAGFDTVNYDVGSDFSQAFIGATLIGTFPTGNQQTGFIGVIDTAGATISAIDIRRGPPGPDGTFNAFDNVSFANAPANAVPAPAGLLLGLTGLPIFGVVARLRRRNAVQA